MLKRLRQEGITILVSTPYMDEATLCDRIGLIQEGKLLAIDTPLHIVDQYPETLYRIRSDRMPVLLQDLRLYPQTLSCFTFGEYLHLSLNDTSETTLSELQQYLKAKQHTGVEMDSVVPTIEDCFIRLLKSK
jgi:ABC-type multidrug transport system ATPase subunit